MTNAWFPFDGPVLSPARFRVQFGRLLLLLLAAAAPAAAEVTRFPIETISIQGTHFASVSVMLAESHLVAGHSYTESELHDGVLRINRLPFVLHTDVRLEKGSARGAYVLVITVEETKPLFISLGEIRRELSAEVPVLDSRAELVGFRKEIVRSTSDRGTLGGRIFVGSKGLLTASITRQGVDHYSLGYTQYNLFGTNASVAVLADYVPRDYSIPAQFGPSPRVTAADQVDAQLIVAVPLFGNNALRGGIDHSPEVFHFGGAPGVPLRSTIVGNDHLQLLWVYDSTTDPIFPTNGTYADAGVDVVSAPLSIKNGSAQFNDYRVAHQTDFEVRADRYYEFLPGQSVQAGADVMSHDGGTYREYVVRGGYSASLLPRLRQLDGGDLRFEAHLSRDYLAFPNQRTTSRGIADVGLAFRNSWGLLRFDFEYTGWRQPK